MMKEFKPSIVRRITGVAAALYICGTPIGAWSAPAPLADPFFSYTRNPDYDSVAKTAGIQVPVRTPDGGSSYIVCDLFRPAQGSVAVDGKFPGIVIDFQAYHLVNILS